MRVLFQWSSISKQACLRFMVAKLAALSIQMLETEGGDDLVVMIMML